MLDLSDLQRSAVKEILNIAIGRAADALNRLVDEEVLLSVPNLLFVARREAGDLIDKRAGKGVSAVTQTFDGPFAGDVFLIFPEEKSLELARSMLADHVALETMTELEQEALTEVGNIVLNASLGTLANLLQLEIASSLPSYLRGTGRTILGVNDGNGAGYGDLALFVEVDFRLQHRNIAGYVLFVLDVTSARRFADLIDEYLASFMG